MSPRVATGVGHSLLGLAHGLAALRGCALTGEPRPRGLGCPRPRRRPSACVWMPCGSSDGGPRRGRAGHHGAGSKLGCRGPTDSGGAGSAGGHDRDRTARSPGRGAPATPRGDRRATRAAHGSRAAARHHPHGRASRRGPTSAGLRLGRGGGAPGHDRGASHYGVVTAGSGAGTFVIFTTASV